jgi:hypothetical protein
MCIGFNNNAVKVFPLFDDSSPDFVDADVPAVAKPKKRPLRKFDDHSGLVVIRFYRR